MLILQYFHILTFIKLPFVIKIVVVSFFDWPFYAGFTVHFCSENTRISLNITCHLSFFQAMDVKPDAIALRPAEFYKSHDITVTTDKEVGIDPDKEIL